LKIKNPGLALGFLFIIFFMRKIFKSFPLPLLIILISGNCYSGGDEISILQDELDMVLMDTYNPCFDQLESDINDDNNITSVIQLSGIGSFSPGDDIMSSSNVKAIVESYDSKKNQLTYYQTAKTGFRSFSIGDKLVGEGSDVLIIEEFVIDFVVPCSELVVSIEEDPEKMIFVFANSEAAIQAELAAQEMMAEIEAEMAKQAALEAFQQKLADEKAAAAAATAAYQAKLEKQAALEAFQQKLADEKAAAASSTAAYLAKVAYEKRVTKILDDLLEELDEFNLSGEYKSTISDELIKEATVKLEEETFVGAISGEIVTEAIHDFCKVNLGLSESNIELFKKALEGGYLGNVGPQVDYGTEFTANRWQKYIDCVGSKR
jgi:hypothetical protein